MNPHCSRRRLLLTTVGLAAAGSIAGCSQQHDAGGSGSDGGSGGGSPDSGASPGGGGSGDDSVQFQLTEINMGMNRIGEFQSLVVTVDHVVMHAKSGDAKTVKFGKSIDLVEHHDDPVALGAETIPPGTYEQLDLFMTVDQATATDGSDETDAFHVQDPYEVELDSTDGYLEIDADSSLTFTLTQSVRDRYDADGYRFLVGYSAIPR